MADALMAVKEPNPNEGAEWREPQPWEADRHPALRSLSMGLMKVRLVPVAKGPVPTEVVHLRVPKTNGFGDLETTILTWNMTWQSGAAAGPWRCFAKEFDDVPKPLQTLLTRTDGRVDLRLVPRFDGDDASTFLAEYTGLYMLLPRDLLQRHGLPEIPVAGWPARSRNLYHEDAARLPIDYRARFQRAFEEHIWPLLFTQSSPTAFSGSDPLRLLTHDLGYWAAHLDAVIRRRMRCAGHVPFRDEVEQREFQKMRDEGGERFDVEMALFGSDAWSGEDEAWDATEELVEVADADGKLRAIIDAIRSHRVQDDFSARWSYAKEDFERRLYRKRSKVKVTFVEVNDAIPVHGARSELHENLLWQDLCGMVDVKERRVVVCLRAGHTRVGDIAAALGYANHSPVSKQLARIRTKARLLLEE